jgi:hypothetical protein
MPRKNWFYLAIIIIFLSTLIFCIFVFPLFSRSPHSPSVAQNKALFVNHFSEKDSWAFEPAPDKYDPNALLDLRYLNEKVAGESGFIQLSPDKENFVMGNGQSIRFWAVNSQIWAKDLTVMKDQARFLAKRGVNLVRWHGQIVPKSPTSPLTEIDFQAREQLWQYVAAMKQEGIYVTLSPYFANAVKIQPSWGFDRDRASMNGLLFFDPEVQKAYKSWLKALLDPVNPYTGIPLKDETAIALIQLQNEDSLLFWTVDQIKGKDLELLKQNFGNWLTQKYGSFPQVQQAWQNTQIEGDDLQTGKIAFYPMWQIVQKKNLSQGQTRRMADQIQFWTETMGRFNQEMVRFLREEIGAKQLINAGNWKTANTPQLNDAERYSYTAAEVIGLNRYYGGIHQGELEGWAIVNGDKFTDSSVLFNPLDLPINIKQVTGHPTIVSESSWVPPLGYQSEGTFLISAFQSLTGLDGLYWFTDDVPQWQQPASANGFVPSLGKWIIATPEILGNFPASALIYRQGYIKQAPVIVQEHRPLQDLWHQMLPLISEESGFDPNRDLTKKQTHSQLTTVNPLAFLVGKVKVTYDSDRSQNQVMELTPYLDEKKRTIQSITGEISWDYGKGVCLLNSPKAQGATGFLKSVGTIKLKDGSITADNEYATVAIAAMDNQTISQSQKILVQVGTIARSTGWKQKIAQWVDQSGQSHQGFEILDYGQAPWAIAKNHLSVTLNNPRLTKATILDMNGMATKKLAIKRNQTGIRFSFPQSSKYVILE